MSNELSILGFGQCGSKVAVEISAGFNPTNLLVGDAPFNFNFKFVKRFFGPLPTDDVGQGPAFYIADLNASNDVYVYHSKAQAIRTALENAPDLPAKDVIDRVNRSNPNIRLEEDDTSLVDEVRKKKDAIKKITALYFQANKQPLLELGGAGGLQYLSEVIANQDTNLLNSIDVRQGGALIGIFSLGGGTGSGSLFSLLTKYKEQIQRYTVGVGVLPDRQNLEECNNAGRYLVKYLGSPNDKRFHSLILFSNEAAKNVIIDAENLPNDLDPMQIVNEYISAFIHDFSLINDEKTITKIGKLFDPMDGKHYLSGICTVGYCSGDGFSARDLFVRAISPMSFETSLAGLAVRVTDEKFGTSKDREIAAVVHRLVRCVDEEESAEDDVRVLRTLTPFYRTVKSVRIFYFISDLSDLPDVYAFQRTIGKFFEYVAGSKVSISINCYHIPTKESLGNSILVLIGGAFSFEVYDSVTQYALHAFIDRGVEDANFLDVFNSKLIDVKKEERSSVSESTGKTIDELLEKYMCHGVENTDEKDRTEIFKHPGVRDVVTEKSIESVLLTKNALKGAMEQILLNFTLGDSRPEPKKNPFDDF